MLTKSKKNSGIVPISRDILNTVREFKLEDENSNVISTFNGNVSIGVPYNQSILDSLEINEKCLKLFYLDESTKEWKKIDNSIVNTESDYVSGEINHFSIFRIMAVDETSPLTPVVTDDGNETTDNTKLHAIWTSSDLETGIIEYQYAIGITPNGAEILNWTSVDKTITGINQSDLKLDNRKIYYVSVKAKNQANLWSEVGISDGIKIDLVQYNLDQTRAFPNPCKTPPITISCLPKEGEINIYVYNIAGELVRTLNENDEIQIGTGSKTAIWDLKNESGESVSSGIYIFKIKAGEGSDKIIKIAIIK